MNYYRNLETDIILSFGNYSDEYYCYTFDDVKNTIARDNNDYIYINNRKIAKERIDHMKILNYDFDELPDYFFKQFR